MKVCNTRIVQCKNGEYQISFEYKGRTFAELFDKTEPKKEIERKFEVLFKGSIKRLNNRLVFLREVWKSQGINMEVENF